ncbi:hypothetical protein PACTADRAFT_50532 [Pachysolen tannophilus NRRL Y-2460]|uniref:Uncharacterized protein n=1 Tax=Pachysolen tannophilus NRRL Y-2460 TaxID=669874 RepID=A0A1E4TSE4_PACTA|nr:hypothetical protein PACTADRAFT_50532 [Pachysolen tannophilus NRRL Y-2460]
MVKANDDPNSIFTVLQSTGRYFSAGADIKDGSILTNDLLDNKDQYWLSKVVSRNIYLTSLFINHKKILVSCLNGPVIGLTAALICLSDLIYCFNDKDVFLLLPFSNIGLVCEGAVSRSLLKRIGISKTNEAILLSKPIYAKELYRLGFINKIYNLDNVKVFNNAVIEDINNVSKNLDHQSILDNKALISQDWKDDLSYSNQAEALAGFAKWCADIPQQRFKELASRGRKHKL